MNDLITDQTVLAILPIVTLGAIGAVVGFYWIWKERREDRRSPTQKS
jgi:hypothetical protein